MNPVNLVDDQLHYLQHILDTVPLTPGTQTHGYFLDIFQLSYADIQRLELTENTWETHNQVSANKLLKLSISFGNLLKTFHLEKAHYESKSGAQQNQNWKKQSRQTADPFDETYATEKPVSVAPYYVSFAKNFFLILKNFDIGSAAGSTASGSGSISNNGPSRLSQVSRSSLGDPEILSPPTMGSHTSAPIMSLPIRLNSRQLLIEKLEINIHLDALFTFKINLQLLKLLFMILKLLLKNYTPPEDGAEEAYRKRNSETSSIFSSVSGTSTGLDSVVSMEDYARLVFEVSRRVSTGILDPFTNLVRESIVKPQVLGGFQELVNNIWLVWCLPLYISYMG